MTERLLRAGGEWDSLIKEKLSNSDLILILVTAHSIHSDYIQQDEIETALFRVQSGAAKVIPIIVSPCAWDLVPIFRDMQGLPTDMLPVIKWKHKEEAWNDVTMGVRATVEAIRKEKEEAKERVKHEAQLNEPERVEKIESDKKERELSNPPKTNPTPTINDPFEGQMVKIPGGSFETGSNEGGFYEKSVHTVSVSDFYMSKFQVTQMQWKSIMNRNPSHFKNCDECPVENVSWNEVQEFIKKLNQKTRKQYRLPTEAEWEYAARAGEPTKYSGSDDLESVAWYDGNSGSKTHPVGKLKANAWGLYDMTGNVWEWCEDNWHDNYNGAPTNGSARLDNSSSNYVFRGGSLNSNGRFCRTTYRNYNGQESSGYYIGFRLVASSLST